MITRSCEMTRPNQAEVLPKDGAQLLHPRTISSSSTLPSGAKFRQLRSNCAGMSGCHSLV